MQITLRHGSIDAINIDTERLLIARSLVNYTLNVQIKGSSNF